MDQTRRQLIQAGCAALWGAGSEAPLATLNPPIVPGVTLADAPIELVGDWGRMVPHSADQVVELMRHACLDGVRLLSDTQPTRLRVDEHPSGPPAVWLHDDGSTTAWVIVDVGERAWCQLAYQFGHELGHVLANSWLRFAPPQPPCQWLEEALVEAFSLRGLGRLAAMWKATPPFPSDNAYGDAVADYRRQTVAEHVKLAQEQGGLQDPHAWLMRNRGDLDATTGLNALGRAFAALVALPEYERAPDCVEALGALNRWPERSSLPLPRYLAEWEVSCREIGASPHLPRRLAELLRPA